MELFIELMMAHGYTRVDSSYLWAEITSSCINVPSIALDIYEHVISNASTPAIDALLTLEPTL